MRRSRKISFSVSPVERTIVARFFTAYALFLLIFFAVKSAWLGRLLEHSFVGPVGYNNFYLLLIPSLFAFFFIVCRNDIRRLKAIPWPRGMHIAVSTGLLAGSMLFAYWATHPSFERFITMHTFIQAHPVHGGPLFAGLLYLSLLLPMLPAIVLVFPLPLLRKYVGAFSFATLLILFAILANPLEALFHIGTVSVVLNAVGTLLEFLPGETIVHAEGWKIAYRGFSVNLGPLCSGFTSLILFVGLFGFIWTNLAKRGNVRHGRSLLALCSGILLLFLLNIIRITLIMIIGSYSSTLGLEFFHGMAGSLFFLIITFFYIKMIFPLLRFPKRACNAK